ncbi:MAG: hypothetical protein Ct9H300mP15_23430 [Gemmatimonadota bacterium]|nr:MAG: hypothetical protein Ct9H300mP15_23430 [Gemmatimonadota bacterium]
MVRIWEQLEFLRPGWTDLVEILLVPFPLAYRILLVIQRTRAMQIMLGLVLLAFIYGAARLVDLVLIRTLLEAIFQYGAIAALVVFQPELRSALARLGRRKWFVFPAPRSRANCRRGVRGCNQFIWFRTRSDNSYTTGNRPGKNMPRLEARLMLVYQRKSSRRYLRPIHPS